MSAMVESESRRKVPSVLPRNSIISSRDKRRLRSYSLEDLLSQRSSLLLQPITSVHRPGAETNGILSTIITAAHNAAHIIGNHGKSSESLDVPYDYPELTVSTEDTIPSSPQSATITPSASLTRGPGLLASSVAFESIQASPLNSLGHGNLDLLHFDQKKRTAVGLTETVQVPTDKDDSEINVGFTGPITSDRKRSLRGRKLIAPTPLSKSPTDLFSSDEDTHSFFQNNSQVENQGAMESTSIHFATKKKNKDFHQTFKKIPRQERLVATFSCALSKDILVQGKGYLSENYFCFNSNILGWVTNLIIPLNEIIQIEKKSTVILFPNGLAFTTLHKKYVFATFLARDATFDLIMKVWNKSIGDKASKNAMKKSDRGSLLLRHSTQKSNSTTRGASGAEYSDGELNTESEQELDLELDFEAGSNIDSPEIKHTPSKSQVKQSNTRKNTRATDLTEENLSDNEHNLTITSSDDENGRLKISDKNSADENPNFHGIKNPGPSTHEPTSFDSGKESSETLIFEYNFEAPLGVVFNVLFGPDTSHYIKILESQKNFDLSRDKITELSNKSKERNYFYTKPLNGPIGPKQTKCLIKEAVKKLDFSNFCEIHQITQTPDVPLGNSFKILTRQIFTWGPNNSTNFTVFSSVEWSAKSWIKGAVEKGSMDGQRSSMKSMADSVVSIISNTSGQGLAPKRKRKHTIASSTIDVKEEKIEVPLTLWDQLSGFLEKLGQSVPILVMSDFSLGCVVLMLTTILYSVLLLKMFRTAPARAFTIEDGIDKVVRFDGGLYYLFPAPDTFVLNENIRRKNEIKLWNWIIDRTEDGNHVTGMERSKVHKSFQGQEMEDVVRIAKEKLEGIFGEFDDRSL